MALWSYTTLWQATSRKGEKPIYFISTRIVDNDQEGQQYRKLGNYC